MGNITALINSAHQGDLNANEELYSLVFNQLRSLARQKMAAEPSEATLQPTALVNEVYLTLASGQNLVWNDRRHFFRTAARAMQRILIDSARRRNSEKRGGRAERVPLSGSFLKSAPLDSDLLDLQDALRELEQVSPLNSELVQLHFFAGLTIAECARTLEISKSTAERKWKFTRVWLRDWMKS